MENATIAHECSPLRRGNDLTKWIQRFCLGIGTPASTALSDILCFKSHTKTQDSRRKSIRLAGRMKLGYYPLPPAEGEIRNLLQFGTEPASVIDPCVGTGAALEQISRGGNLVSMASSLMLRVPRLLQPQASPRFMAVSFANSLPFRPRPSARPPFPSSPMFCSRPTMDCCSSLPPTWIAVCGPLPGRHCQRRHDHPAGEEALRLH